jgi:hypothetical protein
MGEERERERWECRKREKKKKKRLGKVRKEERDRVYFFKIK